MLRSCIQLVKRAPMPEPVQGWRFVVPEDGGEPVLRKGNWRPVSATEVLLQFSKGGRVLRGRASRSAVPEYGAAVARYACLG